jgi:anti-anti-sigma factor
MPETTPSPTVARATGVLDSRTTERLLGELLALTSSGGDIVVDLTDVDLVDSGALGAFLTAAHDARRRGGRLVVRNPSGVVADVLRVGGLGERVLGLESAA